MNRSIAAGLGLVAALVFSLAPSGARATSVIEKDLSDLSNEADMVFVGKVLSVEPRWRDESQKSIETVVTFEVLEALYGTSSGNVVLAFAGGEVDGLREVVAGMPQFTVGEEAMIFASRERSRISPLIGFHQGCFRIAEGPTGRVVLNADNQPVTSVTSRGLSVGKREDGTRRAVPLDQFVATVRQQLGQRGKATP